MFQLRTYIFVFVGVFALGCAAFYFYQKSHQPAPQEVFDDFYAKFLRDSTFQMERIQFPLQGLPHAGDTTIPLQLPFYWQADQWVMHREVPIPEGFEREMEDLGFLVIERVVQPQLKVGFERRFKLDDGKWYLIYYAGLNRVVQRDSSTVE